MDMAAISVGAALVLVLVVLVLQTPPIWFAAKIVGAGKSELLPVAAAVLAGGIISGLLIWSLGLKALLIMPFVYLGIYKFYLETSFLGAFILCVLGLAFQAALNKLLGVLAL